MPQVSSQAQYAPSGFQASDWEIVGDTHYSEEFAPLAVEVIGGTSGRVVDPMFADFGGASTNTSTKRWHMSERHGFQSPEARRAKEEEDERKKGTRYTDDQIAQLKAQALEAGRKQALEEAAEQQQARLGAIETQVTQVIKDLQVQIQEIQARVEKQAVALSLDVAKKLIDGAVEINPEYVIKVIHDALGLVGGALIRKVRVSPQDLEFINLIGLARQIKEYDGTWQFDGDASIKSGCVVETSAGEIDFQLDAAWERVKDNVMKVV